MPMTASWSMAWRWNVHIVGVSSVLLVVRSSVSTFEPWGVLGEHFPDGVVDLDL